MPLYEYYCSDCKSKFELLVSHQNADDVVCARCCSEKVKRLLSTFALTRGGEEDFSDDMAPSFGSCGCNDGGCGNLD